jgi:hypothetical protein
MKKLALLVLVVTACTKVESQDILTHGMFASLQANGDANGTTTVSATLYLGSPGDLNFIELSTGDELRATNSPDSKVMQETNILNIIGYHATFQTNAEDEPFEVSLHREVDNGAPSSLVSLPAPFTITPLAASQSRATSMTVEWSNGGSVDSMRWTITGSCIDDTGAAITADPGSVVIPANMLRKRAASGNQQVPDSCQATLQIVRQREGDLDPGYGKGGSIFGTQIRSVTFTTAP